LWLRQAAAAFYTVQRAKMQSVSLVCRRFASRFFASALFPKNAVTEKGLAFRSPLNLK